nr:dTMP kinase [uncultured Sphaerochaeta sp.]
MEEPGTPAKARFVTFEGGEGVGKSTQIRHLLNHLSRVGISTVRTREPGGTPKAEAIRSFILQGRSEAWGPAAEAVLFAAARHDHVTQLIAPNLAAGNWVLSDRFADSSRAYQGLTGGVDEQTIDALEELAIEGHQPDLTILMDMDPEYAFRRVAERAIEDGVAAPPDRFEKESLDWHRRLRDGFLTIAVRNPGRCVVVSAEKSEEEVEEEIWRVVCERFPELDRTPAPMPKLANGGGE